VGAATGIMSWLRPRRRRIPRRKPAFHQGVCDYRRILLDLLFAAGYVAATVALLVPFEVRTIDTL
jgi:hypothetical protein